MTQPAGLVVIIVLNLNKKDETIRCLRSILELDYTPFEVVVVDNGSSDDSVAAIQRQFAQVHTVRSETNLGVAGGRNFGIEYANAHFRHDFLFFLDNDTWVDPASLRAMVSAMGSEPSIGLVVPKGYREGPPAVFAAAGGHHINWCLGRIRTVGAGEPDHGQYDGWIPPTCSGGMALVRRTVFEQIGGFDNVFNPYGWEDIDFSLRARCAGYDIRLAPRAIVYHAGGKVGRGRALPAYERSKMRGYFVLIKRHARRWQWACFLCLLPLRAIRRAASELRSGRGDIVLAHVRGALEARRGSRR